jgi:hypothetical protein
MQCAPRRNGPNELQRSRRRRWHLPAGRPDTAMSIRIVSSLGRTTQTPINQVMLLIEDRVQQPRSVSGPGVAWSRERLARLACVSARYRLGAPLASRANHYERVSDIARSLCPQSSGGKRRKSRRSDAGQEARGRVGRMLSPGAKTDNSVHQGSIPEHPSPR